MSAYRIQRALLNYQTIGKRALGHLTEGSMGFFVNSNSFYRSIKWQAGGDDYFDDV